MTWRELYEFLSTLSDDELDNDVTIGVVHETEWKGFTKQEQRVDFDSKAEYYGCVCHGVMEGSDTIDDGTPYIGIVT